MKPVILAGGSGSRLWPKSRAALPKQFLALTSSKTMLQETILRLGGAELEAPVVICNEAHRFLVAEQLRRESIEQAAIVLEPVGRNTAPAIALAALQAMQDGSDPILLILAADHLIKDHPAFHQAIEKAQALAQQGHLVTFGIVPEQAHTGYGYIRSGNAIGAGLKVEEFVEKPDLQTAQGYVDSGNYYWNSGMFMFQASQYVKELEKFNPAILNACKEAIEKGERDLDFIRVDATAFAASPDDSIDYAVMEKTALAAMVPLDAGWSDVGSWSSLWETAEKDEQGNVCVGDVMLEGVTNSYINAEQRLIAVIGLDDVVVV